MQPILDNTVNIISIDKHGLLIHSTCLYPFYSPDNTKVGFWVQDYDYSTDIYFDTYHLYIKDLITDNLTKVDIGNGNNPLINDISTNRVLYGAMFSPNSEKILFYSTSTNLIPTDSVLASEVPNSTARWYTYTILDKLYKRVMYDTVYGNLGDHYEALWYDNNNIAIVSFSNNIGGVYNSPIHTEVFLSNITNETVTCISTDPNAIDPFFVVSSYNITITVDKISFYNDLLGQCIKVISTNELIVVQNLPAITNLGTVTTDIFSWNATGDNFLFRINAGTTVDGDNNNVPDDFVYDLSNNTIYSLNENTGGTVFGNGYSKNARFSPDGLLVAFLSSSSNIDPSSNNDIVNLYIKEISTGILTRISKSVLGGNILLDVLGYSWLSNTKLVYTTYSKNIVIEDNNNILDWFVYNINTNTTKRINYTPSGNLLFSTNNESVRNIRRETFNIDGDTILFASILNSFDNTNFITPSFNKYNIFTKVFEDKTLDIPIPGVTKVHPNDAINATIKNTTSSDIYRSEDIIAGVPTTAIVGSQYAERANSIRYRNDIASSVRWLSITYPNLPYDAPNNIKIGAGIFKATSTLLDDILDVKQNLVTTTTNPVIGILTTYEVKPQNDIVLVTSGEDQQRICDPMVLLSATIQGNASFGHTSLWELISGDAIIITPVSFTDAFYIAEGSSKDRVFRYWIDKGKYNEQYQDITIYATPTSTYKANIVADSSIEIPFYPELVIDSYTALIGFDYNIPFNSMAGYTLIQDIEWELPRLFELNDEVSNFYKPQYKGSVLEIHDGNDWVNVIEVLNNQHRLYNSVPAFSTIRFGAIYYDLNQTTSKLYYSTPIITSPTISANNVLSKMPSSGNMVTDYTINTTIYVLELLTLEDTITSNPNSVYLDNTIITNVYTFGSLLPEDTIIGYNTSAPEVSNYTLTFFNGASIGG